MGRSKCPFLPGIVSLMVSASAPVAEAIAVATCPKVGSAAVKCIANACVLKRAVNESPAIVHVQKVGEFENTDVTLKEGCWLCCTELRPGVEIHMCCFTGVGLEGS